MKLRSRISFLAILFLLSQLMIAADTNTVKRGAVATTALAKLPMSFEPAQTSGRFVTSSGSYRVSIGANDSYVAIDNGVSGPKSILHFAFENANPAANLEGIDPLPGVVNYYKGQDPRNWRLGVKTYAKLHAKSVYPGVDVVYYGDHRHLEFDFVVAAGADPKAIALNVDGADELSLSKQGDLVAGINGKEFRFHKPYAYQVIDGQQAPITVEYALNGPNKAILRVGNYDKSTTLVVDPKLTYSTFLGGSQSDSGNGIAIDSAGNAYVAGQSCSSDFIGGSNFKGAATACDAYVTKLDPTGQTVLWTTFIAGATPVPNPATASANGVALDKTGNVYIVGTTNFFDLPLLTTPGATDHTSTYNGGDSDAFISILSSAGALIRETYLGGSGIDQGFGIAVDQQQNVSAVGQTCSPDFPAYNSIQAKTEACVAFVTKLDFGLHIAGPILPGASPLSPRHSSLTDTNCGFGALCPATPNAAQTYYFFSSLFGGQPAPPQQGTWPSLSNDGYQYQPVGIAVPPGAITIAAPSCVSVTKPQVLLALGGGTSAGLTWPCSSVGVNAIVADTGGFNWLDLGPAQQTVIFATTEAYGVALDPVGDVYAVGGTNTADLTPYFFYAGYHGINYEKTGAWILKLSGLDGHQIYATALSQNPDTDTAPDSARAIAVDNSGQAYITGISAGSLTTTPGAAHPGLIGGKDAFVIKLDIPASHFLYGTYLGGKGDDQGLAIAIDGGGAAYVTGSTTSSDLAVINPLLDSSGNAESALLGPQDAFIARLNPSGSATTMMAYLGGASSDQANAIAVDQSGNIFVAGTTQSVDFPVLPATPAVAGKTVFGGGVSDAFVTLINGATFPVASVTPATLNFGSQNVGTTSASQTVTLRNTGNGILNISAINFAGTGGDYSQTNTCGTQLTPAGGAKDNCTITVTFSPTAGGSRPDIIQIVDDSANSPQAVALAGTGVVVQGTIQLSPSTLAFGNQQTSTTSTAKTVTLTNGSSSYALTISSIATGDPSFKQTNNCPVSPATLAASANCTIQVTFAPTTAVAVTTTLTVTGIAQNSPQSIALTGTGTSAGASGAPDFTLTSSTQTITSSASGGAPTFQVQASPLNGFNQALALTCTVPAGATCTAAPATLPMDGTSMPASNITVTIGNGGSTGVPKTAELRHGPQQFLASMLSFGVLGLVAVGRKRRVMLVLMLVLVGTILFSIVGCGATSGSGNNPSNTKITPGTYQVVVTAASSGTNAISHSATVSLTVN